MKYCSKCGSEFPDNYRFCQNDRTVLVSSLESKAASGRTVAVSGGGNGDDFLPEPGEDSSASPSTSLSSTSTSASANRTRAAIIIGGVVLLLLLVVVGVVYKFSGNALESKLDEAISKGNLLAPPGANSYELYHQLKLEGVSPAKLRAFEYRLLPLATARPQQLLNEFSKVGGKEPPVGEWDDAAKLLAWANEMKPNDSGLSARAIYCSGRSAYLGNRKDEAMDLWKRASDLDRAWALPTNGVGLIYNERKEYANARDYLLEATRRNPDWAVPYNNLGTSYFYERDYDQAESFYNQSVARDSRWARPHAWLGAIAMQRKDYSRAALEFESVLDANATGTENIDLDKIREQLERARQLASDAEELE
jgi:tetratricopeptide (TPR) repeat protein